MYCTHIFIYIYTYIYIYIYIYIYTITYHFKVLSLGTPEEQIDEMALWVKAWGDQDYSVRDYRPLVKQIIINKLIIIYIRRCF